MLSIVIPVANEPRNPSLPHALRSIARHYPGQRVILAGHLPQIPVLDLDVIHVPTGEGRASSYSKFAGEALALRTVIQSGLVDDGLIWSNDDIYWLRPAEPIRWALGQLECDFGATIYQKRKHTTWQTLRAHSLPTWDYESHTPLPVTDLHTMTVALNMTGAMRSLYGNLTGTPDQVAGDVKLRARTAPLPDTPWVSTAGDPTRYNCWPFD